MMRFEDSPGLFGCGVGASTYGNAECAVCGTNYHDREDDQGEPLTWDVPIGFATFAGLDLCDCCFERIEEAVIRRAHDIIPWLTRMILAKEAHIAERLMDFQSLKAAIVSRETPKKGD